EMSKSIILKTRTNLEIEVIEARKNLHDETVDLAISIAKKIIKKNIQKNDYQDILDDFSSKLSQVKNSCLH
ncbi:F0F1 ATP synthase subunit B, partial [Buchnera aphidicola]|nr:F0F1 ATP synthase subunit B [Buchnera aphidicola]